MVCEKLKEAVLHSAFEEDRYGEVNAVVQWCYGIMGDGYMEPLAEDWDDHVIPIRWCPFCGKEEITPALLNQVREEADREESEMNREEAE